MSRCSEALERKTFVLRRAYLNHCLQMSHQSLKTLFSVQQNYPSLSPITKSVEDERGKVVAVTIGRHDIDLTA
jgi:hypothetical protein